MCGIFFYLSKQHITKRNLEIYTKFNTILHRGPDSSTFKNFIGNNENNVYLGFKRLKIIGTKGEEGMQPFYCKTTKTYLLANGEIYNYMELYDELKQKYLIPDDYPELKSDCEIILLLYKFYPIEEIVNKIRGEYVFLLLDFDNNILYMVRDELGIRPLFYNITNNDISICSEYKGLVNSIGDAKQIDTSTITYINLNDFNKIIEYNNIKIHLSSVKPVKKYTYFDINNIKPYIKNFDYKRSIKNSLIDAVNIRLNAEREIGFLLSGGFDSSLILSIAANIIVEDYLLHLIPINAFSIKYVGDCECSDYSDNDDITHAKKVVEFINNKYFSIIKRKLITHKIVYFNKQEGIDIIPKVIYHLESWDQTTIRASTPMYLLIKYIKEKTNVKVLFSGECADELFFSYLYSKYAPSAEAFDSECKDLLKNIHYYDVLRADRMISAHGLEVRVPFSDRLFITEYLTTELKYRYEPNKIEKYLIRECFDDCFLPEETRMRTKEAFSNSVNSIKADWIGDIKNYCKNINHTENEYYMVIFDSYHFDKKLIPKYWLPKQDWINTNGESSATILSVYEK
jgi:asparagine synthase (glutamine-hydrolysing)